MEQVWKAIASLQEKLMSFYEQIRTILNTLTTLRHDVERNTRTLKELRTVYIEMSEQPEENNLVAFQ